MRIRIPTELSSRNLHRTQREAFLIPRKSSYEEVIKIQRNQKGNVNRNVIWKIQTQEHEFEGKGTHVSKNRSRESSPREDIVASSFAERKLKKYFTSYIIRWRATNNPHAT